MDAFIAAKQLRRVLCSVPVTARICRRKNQKQVNTVFMFLLNTFDSDTDKQ